MQSSQRQGPASIPRHPLPEHTTIGSSLLLLSLIATVGLASGCRPSYPKCENDTHCKEQGEFCVNGLCQQCREQAHCATCQQCQAGRCVQQAGCCQSSQDCAAGQVCRAGQCAAECLGQADCPPRHACQGQRCVPVACFVDGDCGQGERCVEYVCQGPTGCTLSRIHFDFDEARLTATARSTLEENARCLQTQPVSSLLVEGHCDERGTEEYNLALGDRRARAAAEYLQRLGMKGVRTTSFGENRPLRQESHEGAWSENRRAEFVTR
ncbi:MAG: OmpA family protein [Myxococcota bacterium]|jgi:peptidoglycan-associated lipoprotein|nr:OmpA family protein [Myxococcota bacterium]